jgi:RNA polymerase sigma factor (sigma-70 family)
VNQQDWLASEFEEHRPHLRAVAYRMLGSLADTDDAVQNAWLRASRAEVGEVENPRAWLTTIVGRVALNMLRARKTRSELSLETRVPDPIIDPADGTDPEHEALLADSVGLALQVVLETLTPPERLAFVLHDMFAVPFEAIAPIVERSPEAARQLASRARRRVQGAAPAPETDLDAQWQIVEAFLAAAREGDFDALVAILDPNIVLRADGGAVADLSRRVQGAAAVAEQALYWTRLAELAVRRALVNGAPGVVSLRAGTPFSIGAFTIRHGKIAQMDFLADPQRVARLDLSFLDD